MDTSTQAAVERMLAMHEMTRVLHRYSTAMDTRQWHLMDGVFTADVVADMGGWICRGRDDTVRFIRAAIECCERTHHMNGNLEGDVAGETAHATSRFSAWHRGKAGFANELFLALGTYTDDFVRTDRGWRIARREERSHMEVWLDASRQGDIAKFFAAAFS